MTAKTDKLADAITLLEYDVAQHVAALVAARAAVLDTATIDALTSRVVEATKALALSGAPQDYTAPVAIPDAPVVATDATMAAVIAANIANAPK
jgi:hypothetical protein